MERIKCLICEGETISRPASIAPFLTVYCALGISTTQNRFCPRCDIVFFQRRLTDSEASKLYTNYRGEEYNRVRIGIEAWYADYLSLFENNASTYAVQRVRDYLSMIDVFPEILEYRDILDFGGNGEFPRRIFPAANIFVDDLNAGTQGNQTNKYDLIFASNVFEHLSDPVLVLRGLRERLAPNGMIFVDVPGPTDDSLSEGLLMHTSELFEMHEHINHFSQRSLGLLMQKVGLKPIFERRLKYGVVSVLAVLEESSIVEKYLQEKTVRSTEFDIQQVHAEAKLAVKYGMLAEEAAKRTGQIDVASAAQEELQKVYNSTSWRVTSPIRGIKRTLMKLSGTK